MTMEGELCGVEGTSCDCGAKLELKVQSSMAGYWLGYWCESCGPWSRETEYFRTRQEAEKALLVLGAGSIRNTEFKGFKG